MSTKSNYEIVKIPKTRRTLLDILELGLKNHYTPAFIEIGITEARELLHERKKTNLEKISLLSWILKCIAVSLEGNKELQAYHHKRNKIVVFDDVDISIVVERERLDENNVVKKLPMPYIIRKVNEKSMHEIYKEILNAQTEKIDRHDVNLGAEKRTLESRIFVMLPKFLRNLLFWNRLRKNAFTAKGTLGTVLVSSVGMYSRDSIYGWSVSRSIHPLSILLNSMVKKPAVINDQIVIRQFVCATLGFQHDIVDGAPFTRYIVKLKKLMENAYGLKT